MSLWRAILFQYQSSYMYQTRAEGCYILHFTLVFTDGELSILFHILQEVVNDVSYNYATRTNSNNKDQSGWST